MDNDANAGALAKPSTGAGRGHVSLFYMTLSPASARIRG